MNKHPGRAFLAVVVAALGFAGTAIAAAAAAQQTVRIDSGAISGVPGARPGVTVYRGIPFAMPPVGELRWKAPQPVKPWQGVRAGDRFGAACQQPHQRERVPNNRSVDLPDSPPISEDCLYLNVWTSQTNANAKRPVMVWIYGGAYTEGAGSTPYNHGDTFAADDVVYVSFNYRLGALGFLAHPELTRESPQHASGNYALMDVLAALQWVQRNIAAFGGDPDNVTIFGESAGAAISSALVGTPLAKGLFRRSISESGTYMGLSLARMRAREAAEQQTVTAAEKAGITTLAGLRALSTEDVVKLLPAQGMIVDGYVIPEDLSQVFRQGRQNRVDIIVGSNRDEGSFSGGRGPAMTLERWQTSAAQRWGDATPLGLAAYPATTDAQAVEHNNLLFSDNLAWISRLYAQQQKATGANVFVYHFTHAPPYAADARNLGVCHTCELPYVFNNLGELRLFPDASSPELAAKSDVDARVAAMTHAYWLNFARSGDPNGDGLPRWPAFNDIERGPVLHIAADTKVGDSLGADKVRLYQALYDRLTAQ
ncbi:MAG: carboxylesterase family protein [Nevskiaceae bacterium]|jgi:para-nitrobenzyl esterase|nr:carboxylesterase family protein [Nevskiaceae bacterium]